MARASLSRSLLASAACVTFGLASHAPAAFAQAQQAQEAKRFDIPAQSLSSALLTFGDQCGLQLSLDSSLVTGKRSAGLQGSYTPEQGLRSLLAGTGLIFRFASANTVVIEKQLQTDARMLGPVRVEGANQAVNGVNGSRDVTATEGTGSYTSSALSIASKMPLAIKDTPQSVSVITQQQMRDQNITDFTSLMTQATGVSVVTETDPLAPKFFSRGFAIQRLQVDGGAAMDIGGIANGYGLIPQLDMAIYDHAEVLRGADGLFNGYGAPGGVVSLTRKRALDHAQVVFDGQAGSWSNRRVMIDATAPLGFDGKLKGRGVLAYQDQDYFYDVANGNETVAYGVLEYDLQPSTSVRAGFSSTRQDAVPFVNGLPRYQSGDDLKLPRDTCLCFPWNRYDSDTRELFVGVEHGFNDDWNVKVNLTRIEQDRFNKNGSVSGGVNPGTGTGPTMSANMLGRSSEQHAADLVLDGSFELFGLRQFLVVGANYAKVDGAASENYAAITTGNPAVNVFNFNPNDGAFLEPAAGRPATRYPEWGTEQSGAYATLRLTFFEPLHLNLGVRYGRYEFGSVQDTLCRVVTGCTDSSGTRRALGEVTSTRSVRYDTHDLSWPPTWSLVYDLSDSVSVYGSYSDIYQEQSVYLDHSGNPIDPVTGSNIETGIKWSGRDGRLSIALALYRIEQENFSRLVDFGAYESTRGLLPDGIHQCCYSADQQQTRLSQGADLEVTGELMQGWQVALGYTYNNNEYRGKATGTNEGKPLQTILPEHLLKFWSSYQFGGDGWLRGLSIGGGVNSQTKGYFSGTACIRYRTDASGNVVCDNGNGGSVPYEFTQDFYAVFSARAAYQVSQQWNVALNVNNLTDRTYYQTVASSTYGNWYGEPRNFMLTLRGTF